MSQCTSEFAFDLSKFLGARPPAKRLPLASFLVTERHHVLARVERFALEIDDVLAAEARTILDRVRSEASNAGKTPAQAMGSVADVAVWQGDHLVGVIRPQADGALRLLKLEPSGPGCAVTTIPAPDVLPDQPNGSAKEVVEKA